MVLRIPQIVSSSFYWILYLSLNHICLQILNFHADHCCRAHATNLKNFTRWSLVADTVIEEHISLLAFLFEHTDLTPAFIEELVTLLQDIVTADDIGGTVNVV